MCGIVGVITKASNGFLRQELSLFEELLYLDVVRGRDSTGMFSVLNTGSVDVLKQAVEAAFFLNTDQYKELAREAFSKGQILVGHNRKATLGSITSANAHPFASEGIVLVHNGTMRNHKEVYDTEVDSEAITKLLQEKGIDETLKIISKKDAAFALVWYDVIAKELNMIRNKERPLHLAEIKGSSGYAFASEQKMLEYACDRNTISIEAPKNLKEYVLYTFNKNNELVETNKSSCDESTKVAIHYSKGYSRSYHAGSHGNIYDDWEGYGYIPPQVDKGKPKFYVENKIVMFDPKNIIEPAPDKQKQVLRVVGEAYLPNATSVPAVAFLAGKTKEQVEQLVVSGFLTGVISHVKENQCWVKDLKACNVLCDINANPVAEEEWEELQNFENCINPKCLATLEKSGLEKSMIFRGKSNKLSCLCPKCTVTYIEQYEDSAKGNDLLHLVDELEQEQQNLVEEKATQ